MNVLAATHQYRDQQAFYIALQVNRPCLMTGQVESSMSPPFHCSKPKIAHWLELCHHLLARFVEVVQCLTPPTKAVQPMTMDTLASVYRSLQGIS